MFTGLIQTIGALTRLDHTHIRINCPDANADPLLHDLCVGDSVAVEGVCLTVETPVSRGFVATASPETLSRSTLGLLKDGARVNLEGALRVGSKIGGHFVTGHVDGLGNLESALATDTSWELKFRSPTPEIARYIVPKGSIAVNGISLTVAGCSPSGDWFTVAVIPVTYRETTLQYLQTNQAVNLEGDVLGKYAEKFLGLEAQIQGHPSGVPAVSASFLAEHGYG